MLLDVIPRILNATVNNSIIEPTQELFTSVEMRGERMYKRVSRDKFRNE
jgi:hypothetical protein